jgi:hypothetical protein
VTDVFIMPVVMVDAFAKPIGAVRENDSVVFFNFRADRARQLSRALALDAFDAFDRPGHPGVGKLPADRLVPDGRSRRAALELQNPGRRKVRADDQRRPLAIAVSGFGRLRSKCGQGQGAQGKETRSHRSSPKLVPRAMQISRASPHPAALAQRNGESSIAYIPNCQERFRRGYRPVQESGKGALKRHAGGIIE